MKTNTWDQGLDEMYLAALRCEPRVGARYRHFNEEVYRVTALCIQEEGLVPMVVFHKVGHTALLVRPLEAWKETVMEKLI